MATIRNFPEIDRSARFVVSDEQDCFKPAAFWQYDDASERLNELWETGYRPELWRRVGNLPVSFERLTR